MRWIVFVVLSGLIPYGWCQVRIDHAIAVVNDLDQAKAAYMAKGFFVKEGRLHDNGLLNAHIKFANQSSFELMTVKGAATNALSRKYQSLLANGERGVFLALTGHDHDSLKYRLKELDIPYLETNGKLWRYLSFPGNSYLAHLFFIDYLFDPTTMNDPTNHPNGLSAIASVELEGGDKLRQFLRSIGLQGDDDFSTATGVISLVPYGQASNRPRLLAITFKGEGVSDLWIDWRK